MKICQRDVYFWDFPKDTVKWMCDEKLHPPGFTIRISTTEFECRNTNLAVEFPGAVIPNTRYEDGATIDYTVELKNSDVYPDTAKGSLNITIL